MSTENVIKVPELGLSSQLMDEIRSLVADVKYDHLSTSELVGVLEMLKTEYMLKWLQD